MFLNYNLFYFKMSNSVQSNVVHWCLDPCWVAKCHTNPVGRETREYIKLMGVN